MKEILDIEIRMAKLIAGVPLIARAGAPMMIEEAESILRELRELRIKTAQELG